MMPRWFRLLTKSALTLGVIAALLIVVEPAALWTSLQQAQWTWVGIALLLLPLNLFLEGWVWARLLDAVDGSFSTAGIAKAVLSGLALGFWTPARAGEYAGRALSFAHADRWTVSVTVFIQRMADMAVGVNVGFILLVGALLSGTLPSSIPWLLAAVIGGATGAGLTAFLCVPTLLHQLAEWGDTWLSGLSARTAFLQRLHTRHLLDIVGGSLARYVVFTSQFVCLGLGLAPTAAVSLLAVAVGLTFYAKYLIPSLTLLDLGLREGGAVFFFQLLGLGAAAGLNAALLLFAMNVLLPALIGLPFVARLPLGTSAPDVAASTKFSSILPDR